MVIPVAMRAEMLGRIHEGHLGLVKLIRRARRCLYLPGISKDVTEMARKCDLCMTYQYKQSSQSLTQEIQDFPWHTVGTDIFTLGKKRLLDSHGLFF